MASVGIDVGGTKLLGVALDRRGQVAAQERRPTPRGAEALVDAVADLVDALGPAGAVGVGAPGLVDRRGVVRVAANLEGVEDLDLRGALRRRFPDAAVQIDNDATCAAWAEFRVGAAAGVGDAVLVTLGTGIGGGLVAGGRVLRGAHGFGGEIGHMVVDPHGPRCPCGKRGCWERLASGSGLGRLGREAAEAGRLGAVVAAAGGDAAAVTGEHVTAAAADGDAEARAVMEDFAWWLALGLANLTEIVDPQRFVLGGGLVEAGEVLLAPTRRAFAGLVQAPAARAVEIVAAELGERAGAVGAALLAGEGPGDELRVTGG